MDTSKGRDAVQLAQKAFNDAKIALEKALRTLLTAEAHRQKSL
jgi:hypothetical protein